MNLDTLTRIAQEATKEVPPSEDVTRFIIWQNNVEAFRQRFDPPTVLALLDVARAAEKCDHEIALWQEDANDGEFAIWSRDAMMGAFHELRMALNRAKLEEQA